tara:strand:- start:25 stop:1026 length:1002 start_codon:yes stop_codon:yes gene_type:complete
MKQFLILTLFIVLIASCNSYTNEEEGYSQKIEINISDTGQLKTELSNNIDTAKVYECQCKPKKLLTSNKGYSRNPRTGYGFSKSEWRYSRGNQSLQEKNNLIIKDKILRPRKAVRLHNAHEQTIDSLINEQKIQKQYIDSIIKETKTITLHGFDSIPAEFGIFENVEKVIIAYGKGTKGLDIFPKLKFVNFRMSWSVKIDENEKWLRNIKKLSLQKSRIYNLSSIGLFENLTHLTMNFSGFVGLVPNFDTLKCLNSLMITFNRGDIIELEKIDLGKMPCLKYLHLSADGLKGIPLNIKNSNLDYIYVKHSHLTKAEMNIIKEYKKQVTKAKAH